jgi:hypothetical protein
MNHSKRICYNLHEVSLSIKRWIGLLPRSLTSTEVVVELGRTAKSIPNAYRAAILDGAVTAPANGKELPCWEQLWSDAIRNEETEETVGGAERDGPALVGGCFLKTWIFNADGCARCELAVLVRDV